MKDKLVGKIMAEFVALRAKMYAFRKTDKGEEKALQKVQKSVWFLKALRLMTTRHVCLMLKLYKEQILFENKKHEVYTVNKYKIALNRDDDKRLVQANGITT